MPNWFVTHELFPSTHLLIRQQTVTNSMALLSGVLICKRCRKLVKRGYRQETRLCVCLCRFNPCTVNWKTVKSFHICPAWFACTISISLLVHGCIIAYFFGCWEKVIAFKIIANGFMVYVCLCMFQVALLCAGFLDPNGPNCHAQEEFGASWNGPWRDRVTKYRWSMLDVRPCRSTKTRCSSRTRMQSRRTLLWNKIFEQSRFFPCYRTSAL